ncbi:MAG: chemotaxis protein CheX [Acidobacteriota bacterium]
MADGTRSEALAEAVRGVLETMFFTGAESERPGYASGTAGAIEARLRFDGERPGEFRVLVAPGAARSIAANFLGADEEAEITEAQAGDVVSELANMICGSALSRLEGDVAFDLSHPSVSRLDAEPAAWPDGAARTFDLENGWLTAAIRFEAP